jgi:hypothetical protein
MVTDAAVDVARRKAVLKKGGQTLIAEIQSPPESKFETVATQPPAPQRQNEGTRKLVVRLPAKVRTVTITVTFSPHGTGT